MDSLQLSSHCMAALQTLGTQDENVFSSFCVTSISFLRNGVKHKAVSSAASKIGVPDEIVTNALNAVMLIYTQAARSKASREKLVDSCRKLGLSDNLVHSLCSTYEEHSEELADICLELHSNLPQLNDVQWRIDLDVSTRCARNINRPRILLNLDTVSNDVQADILLETDPSNLLHITEQLEKALAQMRTHQYKRIAKFVKTN